MLLQGKRECHQNTDLSDTHCQSPADTHEERADTLMGLLRTGDHGPDYINVLCGFLQSVQPSGKGLGGHSESSIGRTDTVGNLHIEGIDRKVKGLNRD